MPQTDEPDLGPVSKPTWQNGSLSDGFLGKKRVTRNEDIKAGDINELRQWMELMSVHTHSYTDSVGSC